MGDPRLREARQGQPMSCREKVKSGRYKYSQTVSPTQVRPTRGTALTVSSCLGDLRRRGGAEQERSTSQIKREREILILTNCYTDITSGYGARNVITPQLPVMVRRSWTEKVFSLGTTTQSWGDTSTYRLIHRRYCWPQEEGCMWPARTPATCERE